MIFQNGIHTYLISRRLGFSASPNFRDNLTKQKYNLSRIIFTPHYTKKLPPKWIISLNVTTKTIKHRRNIRKHFLNLGVGKFLEKNMKN